jgi:plastocyanin
MWGAGVASRARAFGLPLLLAAAAVPSANETPTPRPTGDVRVSVWVTGKDGKKTAGQGAVVWIPGSTAAAPIEHGRVASKNKRFEPRVAAIPAGGTIDFPNLDRIHHNVFSLSDRAKFDLGLYKNGASKPVTFEKPGVVRIYCNIHPHMAAYVRVVDGRTYAVAGADGIAALGAVPQGRWPLKVWDERGGEWTGSVDVVAGRIAPVVVTLDSSAYREIPHTRKDGTAYPPPDEDDNRY